MASSTQSSRAAGGTKVDRSVYGIHAHLNGLSHVVINVSDLEKSVEFYERTFPVRRHVRINGPAQAYPALGVDHGQFEGWVLRSKTHSKPPGAVFAESLTRDIHLIQWKDPGPVGTPYKEANHVGLYRHNTLVGDIEAGYAQVIAGGGRPYAAPSRIILTPEDFSVVCFGFLDPDGTTLEMVGPDEPDAQYPGSIHHVNLNCTDLKASYKFYREIIGFDTGLWYAPGKTQPVANGSLGDSLRNPDGSDFTGPEFEFAANLMVQRTDWRTPLDLLEWTLPKPHGKAYESPMNLGISRMAIEVDDIEAAHRKLVDTGYGPISDIDTWDMGEFGERKVVIFRDPDGVFLELIEQPPIPPSDLD